MSIMLRPREMCRQGCSAAVPRAGSGWRRAALRGLAAGLLLAMAGSRPLAAEPGTQAAPALLPAIDQSELFLDLKTKRFHGPLRGSSKTPVQVAVHAPTGSHVVLAYWPRQGRACPTQGEPPPGAEHRAGAPGSAAGPMQKYVVDIGPLDITRPYCFHAEVLRTVPLTPAEQRRVQAAIDDAIETAMDPTWQDGCAGSRPGSPGNSGTISVCRLGAAFMHHLPWSNVDVVSPGSQEPVPIRQAFEQIIESDAKVTDLITRALQGVSAAKAARDALRDAIDRMREESDAWGRDARAAYEHAGHPPVVMTKAELSAFVAGADRALGQDTRSESGGTHLAEHIANLRRSRPLPETPAALAALPGFDKSGNAEHARLDAVISHLTTLALLVDRWRAAEADKRRLTASDSLAALEAAMQRVSRWEPGISEMQHAPSYIERFPLSVSADLGIGGVRFADERWDTFSYFGLSFYFAPVYKELPLAGWDFWRRFSLNVGLSMHHPSLNADAEVKGLLGDRMLLAGAGLRLSNYVRLSAGTMLYKQESRNPLSSRAHLRSAPYLGLSLDLDIIGTVTGWYAGAVKAL